MPKKKSATNTPRSRQAVTLNLSPRAVTTVSGVRIATGITQVAFLERLLEWYAAQDPRIKTMILSPYPQVRTGLAKLIAKEMATNPEKDFDAIEVDALIDHDTASRVESEKLLKR